MAVPTRKKNPEGSGERFKLWPEATYEATVVDALEKESESSGRDMLVLELELYNGDDTKTIKSYIVYEDEDGNQTSWCEAMIDALADKNDPDEGAEASALIGRRCLVELVHEDNTWRGKTRKREKVDMLKRHPDGPIVEDEAPADDYADDGLPF